MLDHRRPSSYHHALVVSPLHLSSAPSDSADDDWDEVAPESTVDTANTIQAALLKQQLLDLASATNRGFQATKEERKRARELIFDLNKLNPTSEPACAYYPEGEASFSSENSPSIAGKWTLVYTDAPDITGLDSSNPLTELGRIGQECRPPTIQNVIEWKRPAWAANLPLAGSDENTRILQKVVTTATASPSKPTIVDLQLSGFQVTTDGAGTATDNLLEAVQTKGLLAALVQARPVDLQGPLSAPFGKFEVLYLDDSLRIIQTGQNYVACNQRMSRDDSWF